jgi:5-methylcytosine-specific restriction endonuclease McrA
LAKLDRHLTRQNAQALLKAATHRSKREIDALVATIAPKPDVPAKIRKLPDRKTSRELRPDGVELSHVEKMGTGPFESPSIEPESDSGMPIAPLPVPERAPAVLEPLSESRYKVQFTASRELCDKLERLQALASHSVRPGDLEALIDMAVTHEIQRLEKKRYAATERPRDKAVRAANTDQKSSPKQSRHIPAAVKRAVIARDGERCAFVDKAGNRCSETKRLEFHHVVAYGRGGPTTEENIQIRCDPHNRYQAELDYGKAAMDHYRKTKSFAKEPRPPNIALNHLSGARSWR